MKRLLTILICLLMLLCTVSCGQQKEVNNTPAVEDVEQEEPTYALDALINRFFTEVFTAYPKSMDPLSIRRGVDTKEYLAVIEECNVTVRDASYKVTPDNGDEPYTVQQLRITIEGGTTEKERDKMMSAFSKIAQAIDVSCSETIAATAVAHMEEQTDTLMDYRFSSGLKVQAYIPIVEEHGVACRIELLTINYQVIEN